MEVLLQYERDGKSRLLGVVRVMRGDEVVRSTSFDTEDFAYMLHLYADALKEHETASAMYQRTDRNLGVTALDDITVQGLREDTDATVEQLANPKPITVRLETKCIDN